MNEENVLNIQLHHDRELFREAVAFTAATTGFAQRLIEKDYFCSLILAYLAEAKHEKLVFKGGTCLAKVHAGFYRLSEDLDFAISIPVTSTRAERSKEITPVKDILHDLFRDVPELREVEAFTGRNASKQYIGTIGYDSVLQEHRETVTIEVALREPFEERIAPLNVATILINPLNRKSSVPLFMLPCISRREAFAEKFRAAMTRRDAAIRDYFDIDYGIRKLGINPSEESLQQMIKKKIQVPGNEEIDISEERMITLRAQIETRLKPVLRDQDFAEFDLPRSFEIVKSMAIKIMR